MKPFRKIMVPIDFSSFAAEALERAADLSRRYDAELTLLHVYQPLVAAIPDGMMQYAPGHLDGFMAELGAQLDAVRITASAAGAVNARTQLRQGVAHDEIVHVAQEFGIDLIVMGSHGRTGLAHVLAGSVAERVMRKASCPVLVVRNAPEPSA